MSGYLWCIAALFALIVVTALLVAPCMLSSRISRDEEQQQERQ